MSNAYSTGSLHLGRKRPSKSRHSMDVHTFTLPHLQSRKGGAVLPWNIAISRLTFQLCYDSKIWRSGVHKPWASLPEFTKQLSRSLTWTGIPYKIDSTQSRGQSTSNLQSTSKTTPTLLTKAQKRWLYFLFFQPLSLKLIYNCPSGEEPTPPPPPYIEISLLEGSATNQDIFRVCFKSIGLGIICSVKIPQKAVTWCENPWRDK